MKGEEVIMITEDKFKEIIEEIKNKMNAEKGRSVYMNAVAGDDVDHFISDRENHMGFRLESRKSIYLKKLQRALDKVRSGTYGFCEECDEPIEANRLNARPTASYCISCKEEQERAEGHKLYSKKSHTAGKTFSYDNVIEFPKESETEKEKILRFEKIKNGRKLN